LLLSGIAAHGCGVLPERGRMLRHRIERVAESDCDDPPEEVTGHVDEELPIQGRASGRLRYHISPRPRCIRARNRRRQFPRPLPRHLPLAAAPSVRREALIPRERPAGTHGARDTPQRLSSRRNAIPQPEASLLRRPPQLPQRGRSPAIAPRPLPISATVAAERRIGVGRKPGLVPGDPQKSRGGPAVAEEGPIPPSFTGCPYCRGHVPSDRIVAGGSLLSALVPSRERFARGVERGEGQEKGESGCGEGGHGSAGVPCGRAAW
jgi:hypothetical protein